MNIIAKTGEIVNHRRIYRLMNKLDLSSAIRKKCKKYVVIQPEQIAKNILNRKFQAVYLTGGSSNFNLYSEYN